MSVALVRKRECVPKKCGSRPIIATQLETSRAYCRVVMQRLRSPRPLNRNSPGFLAPGFDVIVDSLPRWLRQLKSDGPTGLLLPHCGAIDRIPARCNVLDPKCDDIAVPQLAVDCQIEHRQVAGPSLRVRIDQTCFGRNGGFWPMSLPLFQGCRRGAEDVVCA